MHSPQRVPLYIVAVHAAIKSQHAFNLIITELPHLYIYRKQFIPRVIDMRMLHKPFLYIFRYTRLKIKGYSCDIIDTFSNQLWRWTLIYKVARHWHLVLIIYERSIKLQFYKPYIKIIWQLDRFERVHMITACIWCHQRFTAFIFVSVT